MNNGKTWASLPAHPVFDSDGRHHTVDGKRQYSAMLEWRSREISDEFGRRLVELVEQAHPGAITGAGP
jgi:hypothetical protein